MTRLKVVSLTAMLCGCATVRTYSDPVGDLHEYSKIVLSNSASLPLAARLYDDALACSNVVNLADRPLFAPGWRKTIFSKKGEPMTIGAWYQVGAGPGLGGYTRCDLNTTFVPTADSYEIAFDSAAYAKSCHVTALDTSGGQAQTVPNEKIVVRPFHLAVLPNGPWCKDLSEAQAAALGIARPAVAASSPSPGT